MSEINQMTERLTKLIKENGEAHTAALKKRDEEIETLGEASEETKATLIELGKKNDTILEQIEEHAHLLKGDGEGTVAGLATQLIELKKTSDEEKKALNERIDLLEARVVRPGGGEAEGKSQSIADVFFKKIEETPSLKEWKGKGNSPSIEIPGEVAIKALTSSTAGIAGMQPQDRREEPVTQPRRSLKLFDLIPLTATDAASVEFVREVQELTLLSALDAEAAAAQAVASVPNARQFVVGASFVIGNETKTILSIDTGANTITVDSNFAATYPADTVVRSNDFNFTPEAEVKPEVDPTFVAVTENAKTVAAYVVVSRQAYERSAPLRNFLTNHIPLRLRLNAERKILYGQGGDNPNGLMNDADANTIGDADYGGNDSYGAQLRRGLTLAHIAEHEPTGVVVHPSDLEVIELERATTNEYITKLVYDADGTPRIWMLPLVVTTAINKGDFLIGNFSTGAEVHVVKDMTIYMSDQHEGNFLKNMLVILAEMDIIFTIMLPKAFVVGDFSDSPGP